MRGIYRDGSHSLGEGVKTKKPLATLTYFFVISASLKLHFARRYYEKTRRLPGFFCFVWSRRDWLRPAFLHAQAAAILWVGCQNKEAVRYAHLFFRYISLAEVALRSALVRKNPAIAGLLLFCVESEGLAASRIPTRTGGSHPLGGVSKQRSRSLRSLVFSLYQPR